LKVKKIKDIRVRSNAVGGGYKVTLASTDNDNNTNNMTKIITILPFAGKIVDYSDDSHGNRDHDDWTNIDFSHFESQ